MEVINHVSTITQPFDPVKSKVIIDTSPSPDSMINHKVTRRRIVGSTLGNIQQRGERYGLSSSYKVLTRGILIKKWDRIRACLINVCNLTTKQRDVALVLLRLQAYYPQVYPKAAQVAVDAHCSVATVWRTVERLRDMNLLEVVSRFLIRADAQISHLYLLDNLFLVIARYLAEHGCSLLPRWIYSRIRGPLREFEARILQNPVARAGPCSPWLAALHE